MFNALYDLYQQPFQTLPVQVLLGLAIVFVWSIVWNGLGLWFSAKNGQKGWFIAILILNTLGLLPIIYLIWFRKKRDKEDEEKQERKQESEEEEPAEEVIEEESAKEKKAAKVTKKKKK
ncbi:MAG: DUF5652 family protein [Nanoarchaeota archaeon]